MPSNRKTPDVREYLAAERTLLAYARTSLAMMGFGFVIARFSLFLREIPVLGHNVIPARPGLSLWLGIASVVLGIAINGFSVIEYRRTVSRLNEAYEAKCAPGWLPQSGSLAIALLGAIVAAYLAWLR